MYNKRLHADAQTYVLFVGSAALHFTTKSSPVWALVSRALERRSRVQLPEDFVNSENWPAVLDMRADIGARPAVYALLHQEEFGRLQGQSRILYIGKTGRLGGDSQSCRLRIYRYPNGNHARELRRRSALLTDRGIVVLLKWKYVDSSDEATAEESRLLSEYKNEHGELPPFNSKS
jgi:hypothetical protein